MNQTQALTKARAILGKKAVIRVNKIALTGEDRERAREASRQAKAAYDAASEACSARHRAILAADVQLQELRAKRDELEHAWKASQVGVFHRRVEILRDGGFFLTHEAAGDNFDEAISDLQRKKGAGV